MMFKQSNDFLAFIQKEDVTILVVDSGLGGMAICADIARRLPKQRHFKNVSLIYFNAWPEPYKGYNRLESRKEQINTFDRALNSMLQYNPDFILLACNTLSVLFPSTNFFKHCRIPVIDIIDFGVDMVAESVQRSDAGQVIILGTVTTIYSKVHYDRLLQQGIPAKQIVLQACDQLATTIESGPESRQVVEMIHTFLNEATLKLNPSTQTIYAALCCTHFGYCQDQFQTKLSELTGMSVSILNPNHHMTAHLLSYCADRGFDSKHSVKVVSKIKWDSYKINAITERIYPVSNQTGQALSNYNYLPDLF
jgi:glutamate racemase